MSKDFRFAIVIAVWITLIWISRILVLMFDFFQFSYAVYASVGICLFTYLMGLNKRNTTGPVYLGNKWLWLFIGIMLLGGLHGTLHTSEIPPWVITPDADVGQRWVYFRTFILPGIFLQLICLLIAIVYADGDSLPSIENGIIAIVFILDIAVLFTAFTSGFSVSGLAVSDRSEHLTDLGFHSNTLAAILSTGYTLLLGLWLGTDNTKMRILLGITIAFTILGIILTFSRGALMPLVVCSLMFARRGGTQLKIVLAFFLLATLFFLQDAIIQRLSYGSDTGDTDISAGRIDEIWTPLLRDVQNNILLGNGIQSILWADAQQAMEIYPVGLAHNAYLDLMLDLGVVGTGVVLAIYGYFLRGFKRLSNADPSPKYRGLFYGGYLSVISMALIGLTNDRLTPSSSQVLFWIIAGIMLGRMHWLQKQKLLDLRESSRFFENRLGGN